MIIDRVFTPSLAQVAYLIADETTGNVAVIDPRRDIQAYLNWATEHDLRISAVLETHVHADFVSGAPELAVATGAPLYASRQGRQDFPHTPLDDGDEVRVGSLILRAIATPGHTPEHLAYLLINPAQGPEPVALFSGDALFVGEVGRPDLLGELQTHTLASQLYTTVSETLSGLPDAVVVYPGHTAGSSCGRKIGDSPTTTIGDEKRFNYAFRPKTEDEFISTVLSGMPLAPTYYPELKRINKEGAAPIDALKNGAALSPEEVAARARSGAMVIDGRGQEAFGEGHIPGSVALGLGPNFLTWAGWLAPYDRNLILVLDEPTQYPEAVKELRRVGLDQVEGFLDGGIAAWKAAGHPVATLAQITVDGLHSRLEEDSDPPLVLDVRREDEWVEGHIDGARHRFAGEIAQGASVPFEPGQEIAIICGSGYRSSVVASLLQPRGYTSLINVSGGMEAWNEAKLPTVR
jgi:hydroxyacylglutathione hydrolase